MKRRRWLLLAPLAVLVLGGGHLLVARTARCPVGAPTVDELERQRLAAMSVLAHGHTASAPTRAIAALVLGRSSRVEVTTALGPGCTEDLDGALVTCASAEDETVARFDREGALVGIDRSQRRTTAEAAAAELRLRLVAREELGTPERSWGETTGAFLAAPLRQAGASWRFRDLAVDVTATHLAGGVVVREQHRLVGPGKS